MIGGRSSSTPCAAKASIGGSTAQYQCDQNCQNFATLANSLMDYLTFGQNCDSTLANL